MKKVYLLVILALIGCKKEDEGPRFTGDLDFRQEMRSFVIGISEYAKAQNPDFIIIPQNGIELVSANGESDGPLSEPYLSAIDGNGQEDLFYGYDQDDKITPVGEREYLEDFLNLSLDAGNAILVTDYVSTASKMVDSYAQNRAAGYISFAAPDRELRKIPTEIYNENNAQISSLIEIQNFLYLINPEEFATKTEFIDAVTATNYDLIIMDLFFNGTDVFSADELALLKNKANGGKRLVVCYLSIGEAEDYRYYWKSEWNTTKPAWMDRENPDWEGNFKVWYWEPEWQEIIYGNDASYLKKVMDVGFDGVYLDIIDAYEYYE